MKKRSVALWIATILATAYSIYLISYFTGVNTSAEGTAEQIGSALATVLVTPHMVMFALGAVFGWLGILLKASWSALVAAILYAVGAVLFFAYFMFALPIMIVGFVGYAKQKKINAANAAAKAEAV